MPKGTASQDTETLEMALIGFERKRMEIEEKITQIKALLARSPVSSPKKSAAPKAVSETAAPVTAPVTKKRTLSPAARKRIAAAQKKRWAEHRKAQTETTE